MCKLCSVKIKEKPGEDNECARCKKPILVDEDKIVFHDGIYHAFHFTCPVCKNNLGTKENVDYKEYEGKLYCIYDYERVTAPMCFHCRKPIYGRTITALGKQFHPEHFVCSKCEKPFDTSTFYEYMNRAYCQNHYNEVAGARCSRCFQTAVGNKITALGRKWCENHFTCFGCEVNLGTDGTKYQEWDMKPMCQECHDDLPRTVRKKLIEYADIEKKVRLKTNK